MKFNHKSVKTYSKISTNKHLEVARNCIPVTSNVSVLEFCSFIRRLGGLDVLPPAGPFLYNSYRVKLYLGVSITRKFSSLSVQLPDDGFV